MILLYCRGGTLGALHTANSVRQNSFYTACALPLSLFTCSHTHQVLAGVALLAHLIQLTLFDRIASTVRSVFLLLHRIHTIALAGVALLANSIQHDPIRRENSFYTAR